MKGALIGTWLDTKKELVMRAAWDVRGLGGIIMWMMAGGAVSYPLPPLSRGRDLDSQLPGESSQRDKYRWLRRVSIWESQGFRGRDRIALHFSFFILF